LSASFASPLHSSRGGQREKRHVGQSDRFSPIARPRKNMLLGTKFLGLGDPAVDATRQSHLFANIVGGGGAEAGDLPVMEDAEVVELFLNRRRHPGKLLEVVCDPARTGKRLKARAVG